MKWKITMIAWLAAGLLLLTSCLFRPSADPQPSTDGSSPQPGTPSAVVTVPMPSESPSIVLLASVVKKYDETLLLAEISGQTEDAYLIPYKNVPVLDAQGDPISAEQIQPGKIVAVSYDGLILSTYPAQFTPTQIQLEDKPDSAVALYARVLDDLYQQDPGLNQDVSILAFDFTGENLLTPAEQNALCYLMGCTYQKETLIGTFDMLCQKGYIDQEAMLFPDGLLFTLSDTVQEDQTVTFSVSKWRSGLGAVGWDDCTAQRGENGWMYLARETWIS